MAFADKKTFYTHALIHTGVKPFGMQDKHRMNYNDKLDPIILKKIRYMLYFESQYPYTQQFKVAGSMLKQNPHLDLNITIVLDKSNDKRRYNEPTVKEIAIVIPVTDQPIIRKGNLFLQIICYYIN